MNYSKLIKKNEENFIFAKSVQSHMSDVKNAIEARITCAYISEGKNDFIIFPWLHFRETSPPERFSRKILDLL